MKHIEFKDNTNNFLKNLNKDDDNSGENIFPLHEISSFLQISSANNLQSALIQLKERNIDLSNQELNVNALYLDVLFKLLLKQFPSPLPELILTLLDHFFKTSSIFQNLIVENNNFQAVISLLLSPPKESLFPAFKFLNHLCRKDNILKTLQPILNPEIFQSILSVENSEINGFILEILYHLLKLSFHQENSENLENPESNYNNNIISILFLHFHEISNQKIEKNFNICFKFLKLISKDKNFKDEVQTFIPLVKHVIKHPKSNKTLHYAINLCRSLFQNHYDITWLNFKAIMVFAQNNNNLIQISSISLIHELIEFSEEDSNQNQNNDIYDALEDSDLYPTLFEIINSSCYNAKNIVLEILFILSRNHLNNFFHYIITPLSLEFLFNNIFDNSLSEINLHYSLSILLMTIEFGIKISNNSTILQNLNEEIVEAIKSHSSNLNPQISVCVRDLMSLFEKFDIV